MSEQAFEEVIISSEGVTVTKRFEEDEFPVPAIAFEFESERDEEVTVRLTDTVPEPISVEDLGFHPEYGSEYWTMDEEQITFERPLSPDSEYTTVYGIRATGSDDIEQFLTEPELEKVDPPLPEAKKADGSDDDIVKEALAEENELSLDEGDIPDGISEEDLPADADESDIATLELNEPELAEEDDTTVPEDESAPVTEGDSLVSALAAEIQQGGVSDEELTTLREALGITEDAGSTAARLDQLQRDMGDLRAYTAALEEFLDENGTGEELIEGFEEQVEGMTERVSTLESELNAVSETVEEVKTVESDVETVAADVNRVETELSAVSDEVQTVDEELSAVSGDIESVEETLSELEKQVETLASQVTDEDIEERIDDMSQAVSDLQDWQEQIKATFGG